MIAKHTTARTGRVCRFQGAGEKDSKIDIDERAVGRAQWVGGRGALPEGVIFASNLTVVTVPDPPFVFLLPKWDECNNATHHPCTQFIPGQSCPGPLDRKMQHGTLALSWDGRQRVGGLL